MGKGGTFLVLSSRDDHKEHVNVDNTVGLFSTAELGVKQWTVFHRNNK